MHTSFKSLSCLVLSCLSLLVHSQSFTLQAGTGTEIGGNKDGGAVWADFNNDGALDLIVNTNQNNADGRTRLLESDGGINPTFTDVTVTLANGMRNSLGERSVIWGDINNDGNMDIVRNTHSRIEIYINRGITSSPNYMFGVGAGMTPNMIITNLEQDGCTLGDGLNAEGLAFLDYNNDGWLDLLFENGECGIDILENKKLNAASTINTMIGDGTINTDAEATSNGFMEQVTRVGDTKGLPLISANGDFIATGDYDLDGYVDFVVRKPTGTNNAGTDTYYWDLWHNNGDGTFSPNTTVTNDAVTNTTNGNKGGAVFCDFDLDGDLDMYWTDAGINQVWLQTSTGIFTPTAKPTIPGTPNIDGCACADVDGDGDIDLFLGNNAGNSYLYINTTTSTNSVADLSFTRTDIAVGANAEGVNLVDYDHDGDYDLYVNVNGGNNQLWENDLCDGDDCSFIEVFIQDCLDGSTSTRPIVGASMVIRERGGPIVSVAQAGSTSAGHGAQNPPTSIFSLPDSTADYTIDITFPEKNGEVESYSYDFNGADIEDNKLILTALNGTDGSSCESFSVLPVTLASFSAEPDNGGIFLRWSTATEINNDYFNIQHSLDGTTWQTVSQKQGNGSSKQLITYEWQHSSPEFGANYYRLQQFDFDGTSETSKTVVAFHNAEDDFMVYPNPVEESLNVYFGQQFAQTSVDMRLINTAGQSVWNKTLTAPANKLKLYFNQLIPGIYMLEVSNSSYKRQTRLIIK